MLPLPRKLRQDHPGLCLLGFLQEIRSYKTQLPVSCLVRSGVSQSSSGQEDALKTDPTPTHSMLGCFVLSDTAMNIQPFHS